MSQQSSAPDHTADQSTDQPATQPAAKRAGILQAFKAVAWGFFGVRKRSGLETDSTQLSIGQIVLAGLLTAAIFVGALLGIVSLVLS